MRGLTREQRHRSGSRYPGSDPAALGGVRTWDIDAEHAIYAADAILDHAQSGERFTGRSRIQAQVSVMEITDGLVAHETQYFTDPFDAAPGRAALAEPTPARATRS
jgi:hypothetical protein